MESLMSELKLRDMAGPAIAAVFVIGVVLAAGAVIAPFFISIVWGAIIAVAVWRPFGRVRRKLFRGHTTAAAAVAVILMFTAVFSPFAIGAWECTRRPLISQRSCRRCGRGKIRGKSLAMTVQRHR